MLKWSVSLTMLFKEVSFVHRLLAAKEAGFNAVEFMWPSGVDLDTLVAAHQASGVEVALFNVDSGDVPAGERGFPNDPARRDWWRARADTAIALAGKLGCSRLNVQAGNEVPGISHSAMLDCLCENLTWALEQTADITFFLEPLNRFEHPRYILGRTSDALQIVECINHPRMKILFDVYHAQRTEGNLTRLIQEHLEHIGHIQIADSPARNQPGSGEINWKFLLGQLETQNFEGYTGLEYVPVPDTLGSLGWLPYQRRVSCTVNNLSL
jgi:hydroxypyruvate isomerase